jgi:tRNA/rRNA methyltransferase
MSVHKVIDPAIILTRPQMGENIGAAARSMANFGLNDLRLVSPRDGWPNERAKDTASGAFEAGVRVRVFDQLDAALADCHFVYATTARRRDIAKPFSQAKTACTAGVTRAAMNQKIALVFGAERTGLENNEIALCHHLIHIDTMPAFSSLNLGQAVLLIAHHWYHAALSHVCAQKSDDLEHALDFRVYGHESRKDALAPHAEFENLMNRLETALEALHFFKNPKMRPALMRNIRAMLMRSEFSTQEINTFQGIISALMGKKVR